MVTPGCPYLVPLLAESAARSGLLAQAVLAQAVLAQAVNEAGRKLDGPTRAVALAALAGLVILGFALVLLTWLGGRYVRRLSRGNRPRPPALREDDWLRPSRSASGGRATPGQGGEGRFDPPSGNEEDGDKLSDA